MTADRAVSPGDRVHICRDGRKHVAQDPFADRSYRVDWVNSDGTICVSSYRQRENGVKSWVKAK